VDKFFYLNKIQDPAVQCAFVSYREPRIKMFTVFLVLQKLFTFGHLLLPLFDAEDYLEKNPELLTQYPGEEGKVQFRNETFIGLGQVLVSIALIVGAFVLLSLKYSNVLPFFLTAVQLLDLPIKPVMPTQFVISICFTYFGQMYFVPLLACDNLAQVVTVFTILIVNLMIRLHLYFSLTPWIFSLIFLYFFNLMICIGMVSSMVGNCKLIFAQKHMLNAQKNDFEHILSAFPEGVLIAGQPVVADPPEKRAPCEKKQGAPADPEIQN